MMTGNKDMQPVERIKREIHRAVDVIETQLARLEILTAAMVAFSRPIPDYEAGFQHQRHLTANATVLRNSR
jgi:hypothetical protein